MIRRRARFALPDPLRVGLQAHAAVGRVEVARDRSVYVGTVLRVVSPAEQLEEFGLAEPHAVRRLVPAEEELEETDKDVRVATPRQAHLALGEHLEAAFGDLVTPDTLLGDGEAALLLHLTFAIAGKQEGAGEQPEGTMRPSNGAAVARLRRFLRFAFSPGFIFRGCLLPVTHFKPLRGNQRGGLIAAVATRARFC